MGSRVGVGDGMARPWPHGERIDGTSVVGGAVGRPAAFGWDEAIVAGFAAATTRSAAGRLVLDLGCASGALQRQPPRVQASGGPAARRVDPSHLGASGLRPEAVRGAQAAASGAAGRPGVAVGLPDVQAFLDERASAAGEAIQAPEPGVLGAAGKAREAASRMGPGPRVQGLPQVREVAPGWGPATALMLQPGGGGGLRVIAELWRRRNDIKAELLFFLFPLVGRRGRRREGFGEGAARGQA